MSPRNQILEFVPWSTMSVEFVAYLRNQMTERICPLFIFKVRNPWRVVSTTLNLRYVKSSALLRAKVLHEEDDHTACFQ